MNTALSPSPSPAAYLVSEIQQWLDTYAPDKVVGKAVWRSAFAEVDPAWAQLADWSLELSTQLSVAFMEASQRFKDEALDQELVQLNQEVQRFESAFLEKGFLSRFQGSQARRKSAFDKAQALEQRYREAKARHDARQEVLLGVEQLASLLEDAAVLVGQEAPQVRFALSQLLGKKPENDSVFETRALRRRQEIAELGISSMQQLLPRIEQERPQKAEILQKTRALRQRSDEAFNALRERITQSIDKVQLALEEPAASTSSTALSAAPSVVAPINLKKSYSGLRLNGFFAHPKIKEVSRDAGEALIRLNTLDDLEDWAKDPAAIKRVAQDLVVVLKERKLAQAWVPLKESADVRSYSLAVVMSLVTKQPSLLDNEEIREGLAQSIERWSELIPGQLPCLLEKYDLPNEARGLGSYGVSQLAVLLAPTHPKAVFTLINKAPVAFGGDVVQTPQGGQEDAAYWLQQWIASPALKPFHANADWALAVGRLGLDRMHTPQQGQGAMFSVDNPMTAAAKALGSGPIEAVVGFLASAAPSQQRRYDNHSLFLNCDYKFKADKEDLDRQISYLQDLARVYVKHEQPTTVHNLAQWLAHSKRLGNAPESFLKRTSPLLHTLVQSANFLDQRKNDPIPLAKLVAIAQHAPVLLGEVLKGRKVELPDHGVVSTEMYAAQIVAKLPVLANFEDNQRLLRALSQGIGSVNTHSQDQAAKILSEHVGANPNLAIAAAQWARSDTKNHHLKELVQSATTHKVSEKAWVSCIDYAIGSGYSQYLALPHHDWATLLGETLVRHVESYYLLGSSRDSYRDYSFEMFKVIANRARANAPKNVDKCDYLIDLFSRAMEPLIQQCAQFSSETLLDVVDGAFISHVGRTLEHMLIGVERDSWGLPADFLAQQWKECMTTRWEAHKARLFGRREPAPKGLEGELLISMPNEEDQVEFSVYAPQALPIANAHKVLASMKMQHLVNPDAQIKPGAHLRICRESAEGWDVVGLYRQTQVDAYCHLPKLLNVWQTTIAGWQAETPQDIQQWCVDILPYQHGKSRAVQLVDDAGSTITPLHMPTSQCAGYRVCVEEKKSAHSSLGGLTFRALSQEALPLELSVESSKPAKLVSTSCPGGEGPRQLSALPSPIREVDHPPTPLPAPRRSSSWAGPC